MKFVFPILTIINLLPLPPSMLQIVVGIIKGSHWGELIMLVTGKGHWISHLKRSLLRFNGRPKGLEGLSYVHIVAMGG